VVSAMWVFFFVCCLLAIQLTWLSYQLLRTSTLHSNATDYQLHRVVWCCGLEAHSRHV
jgi:hypothetical protein